MQWNCIDAVMLHLVSGDVNGNPAPGQTCALRGCLRTEATLIDAARALFLEQGYVATTLAQVARRAGLAPRTVYVRFGTKATLFRRVVDQALVGDAEPIDVVHRPRTQDAMTAATLAERIEALADVSASIAERAGGLFRSPCRPRASNRNWPEPPRPVAAPPPNSLGRFWTRAAADGLLTSDLDPATSPLLTDLLVCADTVVHLRRTHTWSARMHFALIVDTLTALDPPRPHEPGERGGAAHYRPKTDSAAASTLDPLTPGPQAEL